MAGKVDFLGLGRILDIGTLKALDVGTVRDPKCTGRCDVVGLAGVGLEHHYGDHFVGSLRVVTAKSTIVVRFPVMSARLRIERYHTTKQ